MSFSAALSSSQQPLWLPVAAGALRALPVAMTDPIRCLVQKSPVRAPGRIVYVFSEVERGCMVT